MFRPSWVLRNQLALGSAPVSVHHLQELQSNRIVAILALCSSGEAPLPFGLTHRFEFHRFVLPDHKSCVVLPPSQIQAAYQLLVTLVATGSVYVHCQAGVERSPLLCMAWLMVNRSLSLLDALAYLKSVHPSTGPLPDQLASLRKWYQFYHSGRIPSSSHT